MSVLIKNGHIIDPKNQLDQTADIVIEQGKISKISAAGSETDKLHTDVIDASDCFVIPGLVDLRARFREPGLEHKATLKSEAKAAAKAGVTSVCIPPDTDPVLDRPSMAQMLIEKGRDLGTTKVYPLAALTSNLNGKTLADMWSLFNAGCVGVSNALQPINNALVMRRAMQYAASFDLTVHISAQDSSLSGNGCIHEGATSTRLGLPAIPAAAEIVGVARDIALVETTGAKAHFMGLSCARSVEMIADAQQRGLAITADVDIHHLLLCEDDMLDFDSHYHVQPPLRTQNDKIALQQGVRDGVIQAICSDHQPHDKDAKQTPFSESAPGISSIETLLPQVFELAENNIISQTQAIRATTQAPADILGIAAGNLSIGAAADCCIVRKTSPAPVFNPDTLISSGKNSPYAGQHYHYQAQQTLINGQLI